MGIYDREYYRDSRRGAGLFNGVAPACKAIILINVIVYLCQFMFPTIFSTERFAASSPKIFESFQLWRLITSAFMHSMPDKFHIVLNMLFLWIVGREMESMYGSREFVALYLSAAVFSTLCWATVDYFGRDPGASALGASGAVMAVVVLYALYYPRREMLLFGIVPVEMWLLLVIYLGCDVLRMLQSFQGETGDRVAFAAHLGGATYGYLYKTFDLRLTRFFSARARRPRLRIVKPELYDRDLDAPVTAAPPSPAKSASASAAPRAMPTAVYPPEQLDARLDEVLKKISREGRAGLTDEENRILQQASQRARSKRSDRL